MVNPTRCFGAILISDIYTILEQNRVRCPFQRYKTVFVPYPIVFLQSEVTYTPPGPKSGMLQNTS